MAFTTAAANLEFASGRKDNGLYVAHLFDAELHQDDDISNSMRLRYGTALIFTPKECSMELDEFGKLSLKAGATVLVSHFPGYTNIKVLDDRCRDSVLVELKQGHRTVLGIGQEFTYGRAERFGRLLYGRRNLKRTILNKSVVEIAEFSLAGVFVEDPLLSKLVKSDRLHDKKVLNSLLKSTSCMTLLRSKDKPFLE